MELYKIAKGNFCLNATRYERPHENNFRFHVKINDEHFEYAIDCINKSLGLFSRRDNCQGEYYEDSKTEIE